MTVVLSVLLGGLVGGAVFFLQPPQYTAYLQLYVSSPMAENSPSFLSATQLAQDRVKSYTELATSPRVMSEVIAKLDLGLSPAELQERIAASTTTDTVVINLSATDRSAAQSAALANAVGEALRTTVDDLERPLVSGAAAPVAVRVVQPAAEPTTESSTSMKRLLGIGLLMGLAVGVGLALARNALDTSIKSMEQLREVSGAPNLGRIAFDSRVPKRPLIVHEDPRSPRAEEFKQLRTNVQFVDVGNPHKVLIVTSALPGEGKTTTTVNLAIALSAAGSSVLIIEGDLRRPKAADLLGVDRTVGLTSVLAQRVPLQQAIQVWNGGLIDVLASGPVPPNPSELLASRHTGALLGELRQRYDIILVDTPPLLPVTDAAAIAPFTDGVILVCRSEQTNRTQVAAATEALRAVDSPLRGTVLTMVTRSAHRTLPYSRSYKTDLPNNAVDLRDRPPPAARRPSPTPDARGIPVNGTARIASHGQYPPA